MASAYTNDQQLDLCDKICRILVQVQSHFPSRELTQSELTSTLSAFQTQHEISILPALLKEFILIELTIAHFVKFKAFSLFIPRIVPQRDRIILTVNVHLARVVLG